MLFIFSGIVGCDNFTKLNKPESRISSNNLNESKLNKLLSQAEYAGDHEQGFQTCENLWSDLYSQYFATSVDYFKTDVFLYVPDWIQGGCWNTFYSSAAPQLKLIIDYTAKHNLPIENEVAKVWKVAIYHKMTDYFGPVIYSQFGNGKKSVAYDSQKDIYMDLFKTLDEAVDVLKQNTDASVFEEGDLIYGQRSNNVRLWLIYANSLRLRLAMRIVYADPTKAKEEAEKAINAPEGVMTDNSENAEIESFPPQTRYPHAVTMQWKEYRVSAALVSALKGYKDPRLKFYMNPAINGQGYQGLRNGLPKSAREKLDMNDYSMVYKTMWPANEGGTNPPWPVLTAASVYFLRAEGALRGWNMGGTARQLYNDGIKASLKDRTDASSSEIKKYINSTDKPIALNDRWNSPPVWKVPVKFEVGANFETKLQQIISQEWLAIYPNGYEAWAIRRRTGYPHLYPVIDSKAPNIPRNAIIRRAKFVPEEYDSNHNAVEDAIQMLPTPKDSRMVRVWWDAKGLSKQQ
jgi:hypothetical protein